MQTITDNSDFLSMTIEGELLNVSLSDPFEHPEWTDVVRNKDGTVKNPLALTSIYIVAFLSVLCWFGFPLNFEVISRIVYDKTLRIKPRYILQLGTTFSSFFTLFTNTVDIIHYIFGPNDFLCKIFIFTVGWSYGTFLFNFLLSLIDCFVAITFPLWHRRNVTPRLVIFWSIVLNLALMLAMKWMFIGLVVPLRCAIQLSHAFTVHLVLFLLVILCVVFLCIDYALTWRQLPRSSIPVRQTPRQTAAPTMEEIEMVDLIITSSAPIDNSMTVHTSSATVRRMELKATQTFFFDFLPFFLLPLPVLLFLYFYLTMCISFYSNEDECGDLTWYIPCVAILMSVHAVVNPILSLCLDKDIANKLSPLKILLISRSRRQNLMAAMAV